MNQKKKNKTFNFQLLACNVCSAAGRSTLNFFIGAVFLLSLAFAFPKTSYAQEKTDILFFYMTGCSHCENIKPFIREFEKDHSDVAVHWYNVRESEESRKLFTEYLKKYYATSNGVPSIFIGAKLIQGDAPIKKELESSLSSCMASSRVGACNLKAGLNEAMKEIKEIRETKETGKAGGDQTSKKVEAVTLGRVISAGVIDAINPCAIGVLIFLLAFLLGIEVSKKRLLKIGAAYIFAVFLAYWLAGIGILKFLADFQWARQAMIGAGAIIIFVGIVNFAQALWSKIPLKFAIPESKKPFIKNLMTSASIPAAFIAGFVIAALELPCTGAVYLGILSALACSASKCAGNLYLILYNFIFVLPLIIILLLAAWGWNIEKISHFSDKNKKLIRAVMGIAMVILGIWLIL